MHLIHQWTARRTIYLTCPTEGDKTSTTGAKGKQKQRKTKVMDAVAVRKHISKSH